MIQAQHWSYSLLMTKIIFENKLYVCMNEPSERTIRECHFIIGIIIATIKAIKAIKVE